MCRRARPFSWADWCQTGSVQRTATGEIDFVVTDRRAADAGGLPRRTARSLPRGPRRRRDWRVRHQRRLRGEPDPRQARRALHAARTDPGAEGPGRVARAAARRRRTIERPRRPTRPADDRRTRPVRARPWPLPVAGAGGLFLRRPAAMEREPCRRRRRRGARRLRLRWRSASPP